MGKYRGNGNARAKNGRRPVKFYKKLHREQSLNGKGHVVVPTYFKNAYEIFFGEMDLASAINYFNAIFKNKNQPQRKYSWTQRDLLELRLAFYPETAKELLWYSNGNGKKMTRHHIVPRSRGGGSGENILMIPRYFHETYHTLFGNLTPSEATHFLEVVFTSKDQEKKKRKWTPKELYELQLKIQLESLNKKK